MKKGIKAYELRDKAKSIINVLNWVIQVIQSCKTEEQLNGAENLVELFYKKYPYIARDNTFQIIIDKQKTLI